MPTLCHVYMMVAVHDEGRHHIGLTTDLQQRFDAHNAGCLPHAAANRPSRIETDQAVRVSRVPKGG